MFRHHLLHLIASLRLCTLLCCSPPTRMCAQIHFSTTPGTWHRSSMVEGQSLQTSHKATPIVHLPRSLPSTSPQPSPR